MQSRWENAFSKERMGALRDNGALKVWDAPEAAWDNRQAPIRTEVAADGTTRYFYKDGSVKYGRLGDKN
jgi:hypothetical protein